MNFSIERYRRFAFLTTGVLALVLMAANPGPACPFATWLPYTGINGGTLIAPANGSGYCVNSEVSCAVTTATDQDSRWDLELESYTYPYDTVTYTWSATGGSWKNGNTARSVTWVAPSTPSEGITITCRISDAAVIPRLESGDRDDGDLVRSVQVNVYADTTAPVPGVASSPQYANSSPIVVTYSGASDNCQLDHVELWWKKGVTGQWQTHESLVKTSGSDHFDFSLVDGPGTYYFDLVAEDKAGNRSSEPESGSVGDCSTIYTAGLDTCSFSAVLIPASP